MGESNRHESSWWSCPTHLPTIAVLDNDGTDVGAIPNSVTSMCPRLSPIALMTTLDFGNRRTPTGIILGRHGDSSYLLHGRNIKARMTRTSTEEPRATNLIHADGCRYAASRGGSPAPCLCPRLEDPHSNDDTCGCSSSAAP